MATCPHGCGVGQTIQSIAMAMSPHGCDVGQTGQSVAMVMSPHGSGVSGRRFINVFV